MPDGSQPASSASRIAQLLSDASLGATRLHVLAPHVLFQPDTPAQNVYFLESGQVRIYQVGPQNATRLANILGPGAWFGIAALAGESTHGSRAEVVSNSIIWSMEHDRLWPWMLNQREVLTDLIRQLARRLRAVHDTAARLVFNDCNQRLISTLVQFSQSAAATPDEHGVVLHITHQELAQAVGAARETISLALTQLRQRNLLKTGRNKLVFNPQVLKNFSERLEAGLTPPPSAARE
jgi:CRP/FNR family transcriptional regulator